MLRASPCKALRLRNAFPLVLGSVFVMFVLIVSAQTIHVLRVSDDDGNVLIFERVQEGTPFSHRYIHSVAKCPIVEKFVVDGQYRIVMTESWNCSFGAGIATEPPPGATDRMVDGFYVIENINETLPALSLHPVAFTDHTLTIAGTTWKMSQPPFVEKTVTIDVVEKRCWQYWITRYRPAD